jgi:hypothetical protein
MKLGRTEISIGIVLVLLLVFFLGFTVYAREVSFRNDPSITLDFGTDDVRILNATFYLLKSDGSRGVSFTTHTQTSGYNSVHVIQSTSSLRNGDYVMEATVQDRVGNVHDIEYEFTIQGEEIEIIIVDPSHGVASQETSEHFDVTTEVRVGGTPRKAECIYSTINPQYRYSPGTLGQVLFNETGDVQQKIINFSGVYKLSPNQPKKVFIACKEAGKSLIGQGEFEVGIDTVPPSASVSFDPPQVTEYDATGGLSGDIVVTSSEKAVCKYSTKDVPFNQMQWFPDEADEEMEDFKEEHRAPLSLVATNPKTTYTFYSLCKDRAELIGSNATAVLDVDLSRPIGITVHSPPAFGKEKDITFNFTTTKLSACTINDGKKVQVVTPSQVRSRSHVYDFGTVKEGEWKAHINCSSVSAGVLQESSEEHAFVVDATPPTNLKINGSTITCDNEALEFEPPFTFNATDEASGISKFMYEVPSLNVSWREGEKVEKISTRKLNLTKGQKITLKLIAQNKVELNSTASSFTITYDPLAEKCREKEPPSVILRKQEKPGEVVVTVECFDKSDCDYTTLKYGVSDNRSLCTASRQLGDPYQFSLHRTQYVCFSVKDKVGNPANDTRRVQVDVANTCSDSMHNGDETDVDCGGSCGATCDKGETCSASIDCLSNYCQGNVCLSPSCEDTVRNGGETDVDCGGSACDACSMGKACQQNSDCTTNFCNPLTNLCEVSSCTDGSKGGNETDMDCGGNCKACKSGEKCNVNADCMSDLCQFGLCKATEEQAKGFFSRFWWILVMALAVIAGVAGFLYWRHKPETKSDTTLPPSLSLSHPEDVARRKKQREALQEKARSIRERVHHREKKREAKREHSFDMFKEKKSKKKVRSPFGKAFIVHPIKKVKTELKSPQKEGGWVSFEEFSGKNKPAKKSEKAKLPEPLKTPKKSKDLNGEFAALDKLKTKGKQAIQDLKVDLGISKKKTHGKK